MEKRVLITDIVIVVLMIALSLAFLDTIGKKRDLEKEVDVLKQELVAARKRCTQER